MKKTSSFIIALLALSIIASPLSVSAQTKPTVTKASTSTIEAAPDIEVTANEQDESIVGVTVDEVTGYVENNTYKGTAYLINEATTPLVDVYIESMLFTEMVNGQYTNFFSPQRFGPFSMLPKEKVKINFSYKIPDVFFGKDPVIMLRAMYETGDTLGFSMVPLDAPINPSMKAPVDLQGASLEYHDKVYGPQEGPTVSSEDTYKAHLTLMLKDVLSSKQKVQPKITLTPKVTVYDRIVNGTKVAEATLDTIEITANKKAEAYFDLSGIVKKPGVYEAQIQLFDEAGTERSEFVGIRYIVEGRIVTLKDLTLDYLPVRKGEQINAYAYFGGVPFNIVSETVTKNGSYAFQTKLTTDDGVLIAENSKVVDLDAVDSTMVELLPLMNYYGKAKLELKVVDKGVVYAERTVELNIPRPEQSQIPFYSLLIAAFILLALTIISFKKGNMYLAVITFLLAAAAAGYAIYIDVAHASITYTQKTQYKPESGSLHGPTVSIAITNGAGASIASELNPGEPFYASTIVETSLCLNLDAKLSMTIGKTTKSQTRDGDINKHNNGVMRYNWRFGPFTASNTAGEKRLAFTAKSELNGHPIHGDLDGKSVGYKTYTVHPVTPTSYTCPNGTIVTDPALCTNGTSTPPTTYTCTNGSVVADPALCPSDNPGTSTDPVVPPGMPPVCDNDGACEMGETLGSCDCTNVCDMAKVGQSCSTNQCTGVTDGKFVCTYSGLTCEKDPGFTCDIGQIKKFEANPRDVNQGGRCTLSWETDNVKSCSIKDNEGAVLSGSTTLPDGSIPTAPITKTKRYTLECVADDDTIINAQADCRLNVQFIQF